MSDSSSDEDFSLDWTFYSEREQWKDIQGVEQDDGENPVVAIAYSEKFKDVYNYFRAILLANEKSERALELTADALKLNPANYTVWQYRRDILKELEMNLKEELHYVENVIMNNPKNYQVWHHRRVIVEWLNDGSEELSLTKNVLNMDAKNYHAWQHRQWAIKTFNLFENELFYVDRLISEDIRNNSAWNQRFFVLKHLGLTPEVINREIIYVMNRIQTVKNNESAWNFLKGLLKHDKGKLNDYPEVSEFCENLFNNQNRSPFLLAFLIDLYEEKCLNNIADNGNGDANDSEILKNKIIELCTMMANVYDVIRKKYWMYVADRIQTKLKLNS